MPRMKLRSRWMIRLASACIAVVVRLWMATLRVRVVSADGRQHPIDPDEGPVIYAFWHESLLAPLSKRPKARALISQHADGELIAQVCQRLGIGVIRGSTTRGGSQALLEMVRGGGALHLAITPDGPRGPRRQLQAGVVMVASLTGLPIVPFGVGFTRAWRARSWDRFALPRPGSTMTGVFGEPIHIPRDLGRGGIEEHRQQVEDRLLELTALAENWAQRICAGDAAPPSVPHFDCELHRRTA